MTACTFLRVNMLNMEQVIAQVALPEADRSFSVTFEIVLYRCSLS